MFFFNLYLFFLLFYCLLQPTVVTSQQQVPGCINFTISTELFNPHQPQNELFISFYFGPNEESPAASSHLHLVWQLLGLWKEITTDGCEYSKDHQDPFWNTSAVSAEPGRSSMTPHTPPLWTLSLLHSLKRKLELELRGFRNSFIHFAIRLLKFH